MDYTAYLPILLQVIVITLVIAGLVGVTHLLGPRNNWGNKLDTFECGVKRFGNAREAFGIHYFLVAVLFVLFDVEVVFFYPYAVYFRELGWHGFLAVIMFIAFFLISFYYILKKGVLSWDD